MKYKNRSYDFSYNFVRFDYSYRSIKIKVKGECVMSITATEFKKNLGKYLLLAETVDIFITRNGKVVAKLTNPNQDRVNRAESLFGILSDDRTLEESKKERLSKI